MLNSVKQKWDNLSDAAKASLAFAFSSFFVRGISFITTPIFTRIMDTSQYGYISTYNAWSATIEVLAVVGMTSAGIINVGLNENKDDRDTYLSAITVLGNCITILVFAILFAVNHWGDGQIIMPDRLLVLMFVHFLFYPAQIYWLARQRYELKYRAATIVSIGSSVLGQILAVIFVLKAQNPENCSWIKLTANEVGCMLIAVPIYIMLLIRGKKLFHFTIWKQALWFAVPLIPHYLAQHLMTSADRIMITNMVSPSDTAVYNLVYNVGWLATLVWAAINASFTPFLYGKLNLKEYQRTKEITKILVVMYSVVCICAIVLAPEVIRIMAPVQYYAGVYAIPPIVGSAFLGGLYNLYAGVEFYYKKTSYIAMSTIIAAMLNVALNFFFIPRVSYIGAAYATLISYIVLDLCHYWGYRRAQSDKVYEDGFILKWTLLLLIICLVFTLLYRNNIVRYSVLGVGLAAVLLKRKEIVSYIREVYQGIKK